MDVGSRHAACAMLVSSSLSLFSCSVAIQAFLIVAIISGAVTLLIAILSFCTSRFDAFPLLAALTSIVSSLCALIGMAIVADLNKDGQAKFAYGFALQIVAIVIMLVNAIVLGASWHARKGNKVLSNTAARV